MAESIAKKVKSTCRFIFCTLLFWIIFPPILIVFSPIFLYRQIVKLCAKIFHPDWIGMLNTTDSILYPDPYKSSQFNWSIPSLAFLEGNLNRKSFIQNFEKFVFSQKDSKGRIEFERLKFYGNIWMGYPFWKREDNFQLERHIQYSQKFKDKEISEEEIKIFLGDYNLNPFQEKMSPWEIILFKLKPKHNSKQERFALCFRFHHSLMDAFSFAKLANFLNMKVVEKRKNYLKTRSGWIHKILIYLMCLIYAGDCYIKCFLEFDENVLIIPENQFTGRMHMVASESVDFEIARDAGKVMGVGVTSILHGAIAGGIRNFLRDTKQELPFKIKCAMPLPGPGHPFEGMVNNWVHAFLEYRVKDPDKNKRIQDIQEQMQMFGNSAFPFLISFAQAIQGSFPCWLVYLLRKVYTMNTIIVTNFPGREDDSKFLGKYHLDDLFGFVPRMAGKCGIGITILTGKEKVQFSISVDRGIIQEREAVKKLGCFIVEELKTLAQLE